MFFQINITPKNKKDQKCIQEETAKETHFTLILAPFQPQTKIEIETFVNTTIQCYLDVKNINNRPLNVNVTRKPAEERYIELSWSYTTIQSNSSVVMCMKWSPKEIGSWRDTLQLTDSRHIKYDVIVIATAKRSNLKNMKHESKTLSALKTDQIKNVKTQLCKEESELKNEIIKGYTSVSKRPEIRETLNFNSYKNQNKENVNVAADNKHKVESLEEKYNNVPNNKRSVYEFSKYVDTRTFTNNKFTDNSSNDSEEQDFLFQMQSVTLTVPQEVEICRETYVKQSTDFRNIASINPASQKEFDDSLSPQSQNKIPSDFSLLIDNLALKPHDILQDSSNKHRTLVKDVSVYNNTTSVESMNTDKNGTYNLSPVLSDNIAANLSESDTVNKHFSFCRGSQNIVQLQSKQLPHNVNNLSPITPLKNEWIHSTIALSSSSPIQPDCNSTSVYNLSDNLTHRSIKSLDSLTAKDVLEADMWVKPNNHRRRQTQSCKSINFEVAIQDHSSHSNDASTTFNKTQTFNVEKLAGVCIEISPPKRLPYSKPVARKISPKKCMKATKEKTMCESGIIKKKSHTIVPNKKNANISVSGVKVNKCSIADLSRKKNQTVTISHKSSSTKVTEVDEIFTKFCNPDPFAATVTEDPFLSSTVYYDEKWVYNQEVTFKKWLNALLSPPEGLNTDVETSCVDIGKVWQSCRQMESNILPETKEAVSAKYHTAIRLNALRKAASTMFRQSEIVHVLSRTTVCIEKGILTIRLDRDLHRDIGLQKEVLELFLSYNPLWLRIGLETIYGEIISLQSNNDLVGLTRFLLVRFFSDPSLKKMYPHAYYKKQQTLTFITQMNKFMLKKFLFLVYFLDYAKMKKLIRHDPCLFHKKANIKDSRSILLAFSREILSGVGDVTKVLRSYEYVVSYKQTYLDEFNYALTNVCSDLKDGVRLCRVMELISGRKDLTCQCRVPAISRLQKIYNVDVALKALSQCGYTLTGNIDAKSVADGHREKILSLLWQIIYRYQAPRFEKAAKTLQKWWRSMLLYIRVKNYVHDRKTRAALVVQRFWRYTMARRHFLILKEQHKQRMQQREKAVVTLQRYWFALQDRRKFVQLKSATIKIQRWWRRVQECKYYIQDFKHMRYAAVVIQKRWRARKEMINQKTAHVNTKKACITIQRHWKATLAMKFAHKQYIKLKNIVVFVQIRWRFLKLYNMKKQQRCKEMQATVRITEWWIAILKTRHVRNHFLIMKDAVQTIKRWWLAVNQRRKFLAIKKAAITIQRQWKYYKVQEHRIIRMNLRKSACIKIQNWWRMVRTKRQYLCLLQRRKQQALVLQIWWRSLLKTRQEKTAYDTLRFHTIKIQRRWRALKCTKKQKDEFIALKRSTLYIQRIFRANRVAHSTKQWYNQLKHSTLVIQSYWRMKQERKMYLKISKAILVIQSRWRAYRHGKNVRSEYICMKLTIINIQSRYRSNKLAKQLAQEYDTLRRSTIWIQRKWRAKVNGRLQRKSWKSCRSAVITIQIWWLYVLVAKKCKFVGFKGFKEIEFQSLLDVRQRYYDIINSIIKIQRWWRKVLQKRLDYNTRLRAVQIITDWWISILKKKNATYAATVIQAAWKGYKTRQKQSKAISEVRYRLNVATRTALPTETLAYRCQECIGMLRNYTSIGRLCFCLVSLDMFIRFSPNVCIALCNDELIERIYVTYDLKNRSLPWMNVCLRATSILIALAKFTYATTYVCKPKYALPIVKLLHREINHEELFLHAATLIWLLAHNKEFNEALSSCPQVTWLLQSVHKKVMKQRNKVPTNSELLKKQYSLTPSFKPDWKISPKEIRIFTNMEHAIMMIVKILNIKL